MTEKRPGPAPGVRLIEVSVLWRCPSYREFGYSKMTEKRPGPAPGVRPSYRGVR